jgi:hypothetical protein
VNEFLEHLPAAALVLAAALVFAAMIWADRRVH